MVYYLCDENALPDFSLISSTNSVCLHVCSKTTCSELSYGRILGRIDEGRAISLWAEKSQQTLLMVDTFGLKINICNYWNCSKTLRISTDVDDALNPYIFRTTMARSTNRTLALAYLNFDSDSSMRLVYMPDYNKTEAFVLDRWQATKMVNSPLFLRFDTSGRAIIGYQRFELNSYVFRILRVNLDGRIEHVAEWSLEGPIYEMSTAPKQTISDVVYVGLAGLKAYTFAYTSSAAPSLTPLSSPLASPSTDSSDTNPLDPGAPLAPDASPPNNPTTSNIIGWNHTDMVLIMQSSGERHGFQITIDFWEDYGPIFAVSYVTSNGIMTSLHGTCPISGCTSESMTTWESVSHDSSPFSANTLHPPPVSSTIGRYGAGMFTLPRWRVTLQYTRTFHLMTYPLPSPRNLASYFYSITRSRSLRNSMPFLSPAALFVIVSAVIIVLVMGVFFCRRACSISHLVVANAQLHDAAAASHDHMYREQTDTLSLYYTSLRED